MRLKETTLVLLLSLAAVPVLAGTSIRAYSIEVEIMPRESSIHARSRLTVVAPDDGLDAIEVFLNRGLTLRSASSDMGLSSVIVEADRKGEYRYAPEARPVRIAFERRLEAGEQGTVVLEYDGTIFGDPWGTNRVTESWVELGLYTAWYPLRLDDTDFTFDVVARIDDAYGVAGPGATRIEDGTWRLTSERPTSDIVVIAAPELERRRVGSGRLAVEFSDTGLPDTMIESIDRDAAMIVERMASWFGEPPASSLTVVFADRKRGGGYSRPGLVVVTYDGNPDGYRKFIHHLAHELAHFWWRHAPTTSWEDWLNESFAEYSSLMLVRVAYGEGAWGEYLAKYEERAADAPPVWGVDRADEAAYATLYSKGPLILSRFEASVGQPEFQKLLAAAAKNEIASTADFLLLAEKLISPEASRQLEDWLKE